MDKIYESSTPLTSIDVSISRSTNKVEEVQLQDIVKEIYEKNFVVKCLDSTQLSELEYKPDKFVTE